MKFSSQKLSIQLRTLSRQVISKGYHCPQLSRKSLIECELSLIEAYERNLVAAIGRGENMDPLLARLRGKEKRKKQLIEELDQLTRAAGIVEIDAVRMKRDLEGRVKDTKNLLSRHRAEARQMLRKLLEEPLMCEAFEENGQKGYKSPGRVLTSDSCRLSLSPFVWCPQRDLNPCYCLERAMS